MHDKTKDTNLGIMVKWRWLAPFLARMVIGFVFIQTGLNKLHTLNHSKDVLNFFWIAIPVEHHWDPFFPIIELICGTFVLLGLWTRFTVVPLMGTILVALFNLKLKELTGLNLFAFQEFVMIALLAGLCAAGAGSVSIDRFIFKYD